MEPQTPRRRNVRSERDLFVKCTARPQSPFPNVAPLLTKDIRATGDDPFVDSGKGNFSLKPGVEVGIPDFQAIPFEQIGLKK